jgi:hypothetical protein
MPELPPKKVSRHGLGTATHPYFQIADQSSKRIQQLIASLEKPPRLKSVRPELAFMPRFIDVHKMNPLTEQQLKQAQNSAKDEFGVTHENIMYSETENKVFCVLNAPNKEAVEKHHRKIGLKPDWIHEVKATK